MKWFGLLSLLLSIQLSRAADSLHLIRSVPLEAVLLSTDPLGNAYIVKADNTLLSFNRQGDSTGMLNEVRHGKIAQVDPGNPLHILVFYPSSNTLLVLNNKLSVLYTDYLNTTGLTSVSNVAASADGNLWLFEQASGTLLKTDDQLHILQHSDLRAIDENPVCPCTLTENDRFLYLADTISGIRKFDLYGYISFIETDRIFVRGIQYHFAKTN